MRDDDKIDKDSSDSAIVQSTEHQQLDIRTAAPREDMQVEEEIISRMCIDYILFYAPDPRNGAVTMDNVSIVSAQITGADCFESNPPASTERKMYIQALAALELFSDEYVVEGNCIPSVIYPSDHIAIVADLQIIEC